ncbi:MAG: hypothetical protein ACI4BI_04785 [Anaerotardibacter sp.]
MTQDINSQNPYAKSENDSQFQSTVEQSVAYQAALAREQAKREAEKATAQGQAEAPTVAQAADQTATQAQPAAQAAGQAQVAVAAQAQATAAVDNAAGESWTCGCGASNTGKFCSECGGACPEVVASAQIAGVQDASAQNAGAQVGTQDAAAQTTAAQTTQNSASSDQQANASAGQAYNPYANPNNPYAQQGSNQNSWAPQQPVQPNQASGANANNAQGNSSSQDGPDFSPGSMNFFKKDDPGDMSPGLKWGTRIGWFAIGLVGGIFGIMIAWISASSLGQKYRRQAMMAAWLGLVAQALIYMFFAFSGVQLPFMAQTQTGAESSAAASAGTSSGANAFG